MALTRMLRALPRILLRAVGWLLVILILLFGFQYSTPPLGEPWTAIGILARDAQFDYVSWELQALGVKITQTLYGLHPFMPEADRSRYVRRYMLDLSRAETLERQINTIYADPNVDDPDAESARLRAERDRLREGLRQRQPLAESILEGQVAAVLIDSGFGVAGQLLPPVSAHFTQVPNLLVVSPRDKIRFDISINLDPMPVDEMAALEARIDEAQNVSSLIVPLGGIALYPAMILETSSIAYALDVFSHEWLHHYLFAFPLGYTYDFGGESRIINETAANLFGREMGRMVLARYYPELVPPAAPASPPPPAPEPEPSDPASPAVPAAAEPLPFNFGQAMHETRVQVDTLLAQGKVEEAEAYMESRRQLFVANGYPIRKLNQAFFAFYGGYQSATPGEGGSDPIGPTVQAIRDLSPSIHAWVEVMRGITTREELLRVYEELAREAGKAEQRP